MTRTMTILLAALMGAFLISTITASAWPKQPEDPNNPSFDWDYTDDAPAPEEPFTLWYREPAVLWEEHALPVGNGRSLNGNPLKHTLC